MKHKITPLSQLIQKKTKGKHPFTFEVLEFASLRVFFCTFWCNTNRLLYELLIFLAEMNTNLRK